MKTIYVKFLDPLDVIGTTEVTDNDLKKYCFRAVKFDSEAMALLAYVSTHATWSTLLEDSADVESFVDKALFWIKQNSALGELWLQNNFT